MEVMGVSVSDTRQWAERWFGRCKVTDKRRRRVVIEIVEKMAEDPSGSLPQQMGGWAALKRAYRLLRCEAVSFEDLSCGGWAEARRLAGEYKVVLILQDRTDVDYTRYRKSIAGLGPIGDGRGYGFMLHTALGVVPEERTVVGVMYQRVWCRKEGERERETSYQRQKRWRESEVWAETVTAVGSPPTGVRWVHVADRDSDVFDFLECCEREGVDYLIRVAQNRRVRVGPEEEVDHLMVYARRLAPCGEWEVEVRGGHGRQPRQVRVAVAWDEVQIEPPFHRHRRGKWLRAWLIRVWEMGTPPEGEEPLEWVLLTSVPVHTLAAARERVRWYTHRWMIEDYHQCLKTGCRVEGRYLHHRDRLWRLLAILAQVAARLLALREVARHNPQRPAQEVVPPNMVQVVAARFQLSAEQMSVEQFWHRVAQMGGYLGRARDGPPGWKTLWAGWRQLQLLLEGVALAQILQASSGLPPFRRNG